MSKVKQQLKKRTNKKKSKFKSTNYTLSYILGIIILIAPLILRKINKFPIIPLDSSYSYLITNQNIYSKILNLIPINDNLLIIFSPILGIISLYLFNKITKNYLNKEKRFFASILFVVNPVFISVFTSLNEFTLIIPISLLLILGQISFNNEKSFRKNKRILFLKYGLVALLGACLPLFSLVSATITFACLTLLNNKRLNLFTSSTIILGILMAIFFSDWNIISLFVLIQEKYFSELGATMIPSLFMIILATPIIFHSKNKKIIIPFILLCSTYFYSNDARIFISIISAYFAASSLDYFNSREWEFLSLKKATVLLAYCSLLFISLSSIILIVNSQPSSELATMSNFEMHNAKTIASKDVEYSSRYFTRSEIIDSENSLVQELYQNIRLTKAQKILEELGASFIIISQEQKNTQWSRNDEGLLFLLDNSEMFIKIIDSKNLELWEFRPNPLKAK